MSTFRLLLLTPLLLVTAACHYDEQCQSTACFEGGSRVQRLELHGKCGERIWAIEGSQESVVGNVSLGGTPAGYRQTFPVGVRPRSLRKGECVVLLWRSGNQFTRHFGRAASDSVVHYGVWMSQPIKGSDQQLFTPGGENEPQQSDCPACVV